MSRYVRHVLLLLCSLTLLFFFNVFTHLEVSTSERVQELEILKSFTAARSSSTKATTKASASSSKYAYAYVVGGCNPEAPSYRNYLYNIAVSTKLLRQSGSQSDVIVMVQMSYQSDAKRLPEEDVRLLHAMGIQVRYIPKTRQESFYRTTLDKFRIASLVQYRRVLFMDADLFPLSNLDYLLEMSDRGDLLKPNVVVQGKSSPANGGFFILTPSAENIATINDLVQRRETEARTLPDGFDKYMGWGYPIVAPDYWKSKNEVGTNWTFHAAHGCQGLLYMYVKYAQKNVSIFQNDGTLEQWSVDEHGELVLEKLHDALPYQPRPARYASMIRNDFLYSPFPPFRDFVHMSGRNKPWLADSSSSLSNVKKFWRKVLAEINEEHGLGLNLIALGEKSDQKKERPSLGTHPKGKDVLTANSNLLEPLYE